MKLSSSTARLRIAASTSAFALALITAGVQAGQIAPVPNLGTITVSGSDTNGIAFGNFGQIDITGTGTLTNFGGALNNAAGAKVTNDGTLKNVSATVNNNGLVLNHSALYNGDGVLFGGTINNNANGTINNFGGTITNYNGSTLVNGGTVNNSSGTINNSGFFSNRDSFNNGDGFLFDGTLNNKDIGTFTNFGGTLTNYNGSTIVNDGTMNNVSAVVNNSGFLSNRGFLNNGDGVLFSGTFNNKDIGTLINFGGTITNYNGSSLINDGTLKNSAAIIDNSGFLSNRGTLNNGDGVLFNGTLNNKDIGTFTNFTGTLNNYNGSTFTNDGELNNSSAIINNFGSLKNNGTLNNGDGVIFSGTINNSALGTITNTKTLNNYYGSQLKNDGELDNSGSILNAGTVVIGSAGTVKGNGTYTQIDGVTQVDGSFRQGLTVLQGGILHGTGTVGGPLQNQAIVKGDGMGGITLTGAVSGAGSYQGRVTFEGSFSPGNSPAFITGETMVFAASNRLVMQLGGLSRGSQYDAINAIALSLDGLLELALIDAGSGLFDPNAGDFFDLLKAESIVGDFAGFDLPTLAAGLAWDHQLIDLGNGFEVYRMLVVGQTGFPIEVPEPSSLLVMLGGLVGTLGTLRRRQRSPV